MKNNKLKITILLEVIIFVIILLLVINKEPKTEVIEIEVLPITYQSESNDIIIETAIGKSETVEEKAEQEIAEKLDNIKSIKDKKEWFIQYKKIMDEYSDIFYGSETVYDYFSEDEIYLVQRTVETECYGGDFESKLNVANVIFNRIDNEKFENDLESVVTEPNQFAYGRTEISEDTMLAVEYAFAVEDTTNGCIGFHSNSKTENFNGWKYQFTDSIGHHFYK